MTSELKEKVLDLLDLKREDYWDFKESWHNNNAELLHDIICLANNLTDNDGLLIFGIRDKTYEIIGIETDQKRKTQQNVIDFLKQVSFVSDIRPTIEIKEIEIDNHKLDILCIKNDTYTPYFLKLDYRDKGILVKANYIYARIKDTNTPIDKSADINEIEYLWKKRFLLTSSPVKRIFKALENPIDWTEQIDNHITVYHNDYNPEYTVSLISEENYNSKSEFYAYKFPDTSVRYGEMIVSYFNTKIYSCDYVVLDGGRYIATIPKWNYIEEKPFSKMITYKSYVMGCEEFILFEFLNHIEKNSEEWYYREKFLSSILVFENKCGQEKFDTYIKENFKEIFDEIEEETKNIKVFNVPDNENEEVIKNRLAVAKILKAKQEMLLTD